jgi:glycosyltransferase involved in cell wall biosynthesis
MRRRAVLHLITTLEREGAQTLLLNTLPLLDPDRYQVRLAYLYKRASALREFALPPGTDVLDLSRDGEFDLVRATLRLREELASGRVHLLHTHLAHAGIVGRVAARLAGFERVVSTRHYGYEPSRFLSVGRWEDRVTDWSARTIAISETVRRHLVERGLTAAEKVRVVYNGIDPDLVSPARVAPQRDTPLEVPTFGAIGRLQAQKGFPVLLRAFASLRRDLPAARLEIAGDGTMRDELQALASELGLDDAVRFLGSLAYPELLARLRGWDAFVLSSLWEGLPLVVAEAMALERPMVATDVGSVAEIVADGETGLLVPGNDPAALADGMRRLLADRDRAAAMGRLGRTRVIERFSLAASARRLEAVYDELG